MSRARRAGLACCSTSRRATWSGSSTSPPTSSRRSMRRRGSARWQEISEVHEEDDRGARRQGAGRAGRARPSASAVQVQDAHRGSRRSLTSDRRGAAAGRACRAARRVRRAQHAPARPTGRGRGRGHLVPGRHRSSARARRSTTTESRRFGRSYEAATERIESSAQYEASGGTALAGAERDQITYEADEAEEADRGSPGRADQARRRRSGTRPSSAITDLKELQILSETQYRELQEVVPPGVFKAGMGAEAVYEYVVEADRPRSAGAATPRGDAG